jgi:hypothetical protein
MITVTCPRCDAVHDHAVRACPMCGSVRQGGTANVPAPSDPTGSVSYSERYRGTQWGQPVAPVVPVEARGAGLAARRTALIVTGVAASILAGVGAFVIAAPTVDRPAAPLPAVAVAPSASDALASAGIVPLDTPGAPGADASPEVGPTPPASAPTGPAEPRPSRGPGRGSVVDAFTDVVSDPDAAFRLAVDGSFRIGNEATGIRLEFDIAGDDAAGTMTADQGRVRVKAAMVVKDGVTYIKPAGEPWSVDDAGRAAGSLSNPFTTADGSLQGLVHAGTVRRGGVTLHHLRIPRVDWQRLSAAFLDQDQGGMALRDVDVDVYVTARGVPHSAVVAMDGTMIDDGVEVDVTFRLDYRFSRFGDRFSIEAPDVPSDPGTSG